MQKYYYLSIGAIVIAIIAIFMTATSDKITIEESLADQVISSGSLRVGYIVYPPSLNKDPNTGELSGISYDIVNAAAKNLGLKAEWVEEVGWDSAIEGLHAGRYDIVGTMVWSNSARARVAGLSTPVAFSAVNTYVRADDTRFDNSLAILNAPNYTVATVDGEMTSFIHKADFPNAKTYSLPQTSTLSEAMLGVATGKADVTFVEPAIARDFEKNNPGTVRQVGNTPIRTLANVFVIDRGEEEFLGMWNGALNELIADGTVIRTLETYKAKDSYLPTAPAYGITW